MWLEFHKVWCNYFCVILFGCNKAGYIINRYPCNYNLLQTKQNVLMVSVCEGRCGCECFHAAVEITNNQLYPPNRWSGSFFSSSNLTIWIL